MHTHGCSRKGILQGTALDLASKWRVSVLGKCQMPPPTAIWKPLRTTVRSYSYLCLLRGNKGSERVRNTQKVKEEVCDRGRSCICLYNSRTRFLTIGWFAHWLHWVGIKPEPRALELPSQMLPSFPCFNSIHISEEDVLAAAKKTQKNNKPTSTLWRRN